MSTVQNPKYSVLLSHMAKKGSKPSCLRSGIQKILGVFAWKMNQFPVNLLFIDKSALYQISNSMTTRQKWQDNRSRRDKDDSSDL